MAVPQLRVHLSPRLVDPAEMAGGVAIVIDLLRASTTIVHALAAGAAGVIPCGTVEEARARAAAVPGALLAGERHALKVPGFDLGNSPGEFTPGTVAGRTVVLTTTNGTPAIARCGHAARVVIGCFNNLGAALRAALESGRGGRAVHLLCAGIKGEACLEDTICAGALVRAITDRTPTGVLCGAVSTAFAAWETARRRGAAAALRKTRGGRNLMAAGLEGDIDTCAAIDSRPVLPVLDPGGVIRAAPGLPRG